MRARWGRFCLVFGLAPLAAARPKPLKVLLTNFILQNLPRCKITLRKDLYYPTKTFIKVSLKIEHSGALALLGESFYIRSVCLNIFTIFSIENQSLKFIENAVRNLLF